MPDSDFNTVRANSQEPHACTPEDGPPGIRIAAPQRGPREDGVYPLCGYLEFTHADLVGFAKEFPDARFDLRIVASAPALGLVRWGQLAGAEERKRISYPELDAGESADTGIANYFNPDLVSQLGLPDTPATWHVYAYFAGHVSNTLTIRVGPRS
jgi:hypothetical protein